MLISIVYKRDGQSDYINTEIQMITEAWRNWEIKNVESSSISELYSTNDLDANMSVSSKLWPFDDHMLTAARPPNELYHRLTVFEVASARDKNYETGNRVDYYHRRGKSQHGPVEFLARNSLCRNGRHLNKEI